MIPEVQIDLANGVLTITLSRSDKKNALTNTMYAALADAIERADTDEGIRVLLLQADGDTFTAGNDIGEFTAQASNNVQAERHVIRFLRNLAKTGTPLVAAVQGKAVGIGTTLLLHCDYVVVAEDAQLTTPFANLALVPEAGSSYLLPKRIGHSRAFAMFALGEPVCAQDAVAFGIANKMVPVAELHATAKQTAQALAAKPSGSLVATKRLMRDSERLLAQFDRESSDFALRLQSAEAQEAFTAFLQKRQPDFSRIK